MNSKWRRVLSILLSFVLTVGLAGSGPGLSLAAQAAEASYSVMLTGGENASAVGGLTVQEGLTGEMEAVTFTANDGYYFEEFEDIVSSGITAAWTDETEVTVSGTPVSDAEITIPDAVEITDPVEETVSVEKAESVEETVESVAEGTTEAPAEETEKTQVTEESVAEGTTEAPAEETESTNGTASDKKTETETSVAPETITVEESAKAEEATTATEWHVGDTINLAGKYFYPTKDSTAAMPTDNKENIVPSPQYNSGSWSGGWYFSNCIANIFGFNNTIEIVPPSGIPSSIMPIGFRVNEGDGSANSPYRFELVYSFDLVLSPSEPQTTSLEGKVCFNACVIPLDAEDRSVKWSVSGDTTDAVKLYSDEACTVEVGTEATETLTVYAKGISAGTATVTVTANADNAKTASCNVTVNNAYGLWIGETQVTVDNSADVLGNGTVSFDPETNTLTLNNATITDKHKIYDEYGWINTYGIYSERENLIIVLEGTNNIGDKDDRPIWGINIWTGDMTIQGDGTLDVVGSEAAISGYGESLTIKGGTITATGEQFAIQGNAIIINGGKITATANYTDIGAGVITINGGEINATAEGEYSFGIKSYMGDLTISGGEVTVTSSYCGLCSNNDIVLKNGIKKLEVKGIVKPEEGVYPIISWGNISMMVGSKPRFPKKSCALYAGN